MSDIGKSSPDVPRDPETSACPDGDHLGEVIVKRKRGRPPKSQGRLSVDSPVQSVTLLNEGVSVSALQSGLSTPLGEESSIKRKRGRPRKSHEQPTQGSVNESMSSSPLTRDVSMLTLKGTDAVSSQNSIIQRARPPPKSFSQISMTLSAQLQGRDLETSLNDAKSLSTTALEDTSVDTSVKVSDPLQCAVATPPHRDDCSSHDRINIKRKRGRLPKVQSATVPKESQLSPSLSESPSVPTPRRRGRPPKARSNSTSKGSFLDKHVADCSLEYDSSSGKGKPADEFLGDDFGKSGFSSCASWLTERGRHSVFKCVGSDSVPGGKQLIEHDGVLTEREGRGEIVHVGFFCKVGDVDIKTLTSNKNRLGLFLKHHQSGDDHNDCANLENVIAHSVHRQSGDGHNDCASLENMKTYSVYFVKDLCDDMPGGEVSEQCTYCSNGYIPYKKSKLELVNGGVACSHQERENILPSALEQGRNSRFQQSVCSFTHNSSPLSQSDHEPEAVESTFQELRNGQLLSVTKVKRRGRPVKQLPQVSLTSIGMGKRRGRPPKKLSLTSAVAADRGRNSTIDLCVESEAATLRRRQASNPSLASETAEILQKDVAFPVPAVARRGRPRKRGLFSAVSSNNRSTKEHRPSRKRQKTSSMTVQSVRQSERHSLGNRVRGSFALFSQESFEEEPSVFFSPQAVRQARLTRKGLGHPVRKCETLSSSKDVDCPLEVPGAGVRGPSFAIDQGITARKRGRPRKHSITPQASGSAREDQDSCSHGNVDFFNENLKTRVKHAFPVRRRGRPRKQRILPQASDSFLENQDSLSHGNVNILNENRSIPAERKWGRPRKYRVLPQVSVSSLENQDSLSHGNAGFLNENPSFPADCSLPVRKRGRPRKHRILPKASDNSLENLGSLSHDFLNENVSIPMARALLVKRRGRPRKHKILSQVSVGSLENLDSLSHGSADFLNISVDHALPVRRRGRPRKHGILPKDNYNSLEKQSKSEVSQSIAQNQYFPVRRRGRPRKHRSLQSFSSAMDQDHPFHDNAHLFSVHGKASMAAVGTGKAVTCLPVTSFEEDSSSMKGSYRVGVESHLSVRTPTAAFTGFLPLSATHPNTMHRRGPGRPKKTLKRSEERFSDKPETGCGDGLSKLDQSPSFNGLTSHKRARGRPRLLHGKPKRQACHHSSSRVCFVCESEGCSAWRMLSERRGSPKRNRRNKAGKLKRGVLPTLHQDTPNEVDSHVLPFHHTPIDFSERVAQPAAQEGLHVVYLDCAVEGFVGTVQSTYGREASDEALHTKSMLSSSLLKSVGRAVGGSERLGGDGRVSETFGRNILQTLARCVSYEGSVSCEGDVNYGEAIGGVSCIEQRGGDMNGIDPLGNDKSCVELLGGGTSSVKHLEGVETLGGANSCTESCAEPSGRAVNCVEMLKMDLSYAEPPGGGVNCVKPSMGDMSCGEPLESSIGYAEQLEEVLYFQPAGRNVNCVEALGGVAGVPGIEEGMAAVQNGMSGIERCMTGVELLRRGPHSTHFHAPVAEKMESGRRTSMLLPNVPTLYPTLLDASSSSVLMTGCVRHDSQQEACGPEEVEDGGEDFFMVVQNSDFEDDDDDVKKPSQEDGGLAHSCPVVGPAEESQRCLMLPSDSVVPSLESVLGFSQDSEAFSDQKVRSKKHVYLYKF